MVKSAGGAMLRSPIGHSLPSEILLSPGLVPKLTPQYSVPSVVSSAVKLIVVTIDDDVPNPGFQEPDNVPVMSVFGSAAGEPLPTTVQ